MNLFRSALRNFENMGIRLNQLRLGGKVLVIFTSYWLDNTLNCIFLIREVDSISEMANSIFITSVTTTICTCSTIFIVNATKLFDLINNVERIVDIGKISPFMLLKFSYQKSPVHKIFYQFLKKISIGKESKNEKKVWVGQSTNREMEQSTLFFHHKNTTIGFNFAKNDYEPFHLFHH